MQTSLFNKIKGHRLVIGGLVLYLLAVIGFIAPMHSHGNDHTDRQHSDCQLCQVSSEVFLTPIATVALTLSCCFIQKVEVVINPSLVTRHSAFSPRGPPTV